MKAVPQATMTGRRIISEDSDKARELYAKSRFGEIEQGCVHFSVYEGLFLLDKEKLRIVDGQGKLITHSRFIKRMKGKNDFLVRYAVFKDLRSRGYIVKTALKFGADFRVYDKGIKPGEDHARWIVFCVHESEKQTWKDFSAKNRVAHPTKKNLLIAVVDDELDATYWEVSWVKP